MHIRLAAMAALWGPIATERRGGRGQEADGAAGAALNTTILLLAGPGLVQWRTLDGASERCLAGSGSKIWVAQRHG